MILSHLKVEQLYHVVPDRGIYGEFIFIVPLAFEMGLTWIIGREPLIDTPAQKAIYIPSPCVTRTIARIYSSRSRGVPVHVLEALSSKQKIITKRTKLVVTKHILQTEDEFEIEKIPVSFRYKTEEAKKNDSERKELDTHY